MNDFILSRISIKIFANIRLEAWMHRCDRLPSCYTCFTPFHARHRCQGSFSRGQGEARVAIHSMFGFAIGHRSQPRFGETCRGKKKSRENVCPRTFHLERQISRRENVFIFDSPASAKCLFHESSSLSRSHRIQCFERFDKREYMNLNRKLIPRKNSRCY